jgi:hypothetical protein
MEIADAKAVLPLPALLNSFGISAPDRDKFNIKCPLHSEQNGESFSVERKNGSWVWKCFGKCGRGGDEITFLEVHESLTRCAAIQRYCELAGGNGQITRRVAPAPPQTQKQRAIEFDWDKCVSPLKSEERIARERGYSTELVAELQADGLIGSFNGHIAFPVHRNGKVVGVHYKVKDHWEYYPKGTKTVPLVIGELAPGPVHVFESQWDAFAYMDVSGERDGIIITRGASNGALVASLIPAGSTAYVWTQNDEPDPKTGKKAAEEWQAAICASTSVTVKQVRIPEQYKDLNDWVRAGADSNDLIQAILNAEVVREAIVRTLDQFVVDEETDGGNLLGKRWLCRRGGVLVAAPTGIGKSTFQIQASINWALGRDHFGIKPSGKLRILIIQAENDDGDIAEIRDGIFVGLNLSEEARAEACAAIEVVCESAVTGANFIALVRRLVAQHRPDLIIIDPFFAYLGDSVSEQKAVSAFLRNGLNPILQEYGCGVVLVHHTNKPKTGREKPDWQAGDYAYLGAGTAEIANWARAVMVIRSIGSYTVFSVELGKRGRRAGLVNDDGEAIYSFYIKHARTGGICWEAATDDDFVSQGKGTAKTTDDIYRLLPMEGDISQARLLESAKIAGIGINLARELIDELIDERPQRAFLWLTKRPGTRPEKSYSRQEQELFNE